MEYKSLLASRFTIPAQAGASKLMTAEEAVQRFVEPGASLHFMAGHGRGFQLMNAVARVFRGRKPDFTMLQASVSDTAIASLDAGLYRKLVTTFVGDTYPVPGPNPIAREAIKKHSIEIEHWSLLSYSQRLWAGAQGLSHTVTRSIAGSSMEKNPGVRVLEDPDRPDEKITLIPALVPEISFVQAIAADAAGNVILSFPLGEGPWGAQAASKGVIVGAERIVPTEEIRRYSDHVFIPAHKVLAVVDFPLGCHPKGMPSHGYPGGRGYADDYPFLEETRLAARKGRDVYDAWIEKWVYGIKSPADYQEKLGRERLDYIYSNTRPDSWKPEIDARLPELKAPSEGITPAEKGIVFGARIMRDLIRTEGYQSILAGVGPSNLAAWLAEYFIRQDGGAVSLMAELGYFGFTPRPADPFLFNFRNAPTCTLTGGILDILGTMVSGRGSKCLGALAAAQIDPAGNLNSTRLADGAVLTGSGGANDVASGAEATVVVTVLAKNRFVKELPYVTSPGRHVEYVVTDKAVLKKLDGELALWGIAKDVDIAADIEPSFGWTLKRHPELRELEPATTEEIALLRLFDPRGLFREK